MTPALDEQIVRPVDVNAELSRILASSEFASSKQMTSFLRYIVNETLAGRSDGLKERTVARGAFGRELRFDPRLDCVVRVVAGKVRRALKHYYADQGAVDEVFIEVPKGCYCPQIRRNHDAADANTNGAVVETTASPSSSHPRRIVAVVPLRLFTVGARERLLADILTDDMVVRLGRIDGLEVIDCLASGKPDSVHESLRESAARLHADYVFGGTLSRVGVKIRLTARLIDGYSGAIVWADQYDREYVQGSLTQQDDIADSIVAGISSHFEVA